ncbi:DUF624 domain-containing protein [Eubacteriales bacterium OttesenSCG-928-A19]|nr:DUF624 domain-containing protein [Eubacteriales bacterium OttesenSCG-928-A19]
MLGKFFNSFYYGKAGKGDYTPENLPQNRVQLFFEVLRVRWSSMIRLNLLYILFWLPALIWSFWNYFAAENVLTMFAAGEMTQVQMMDQLSGLLWMWLLILWPCIAITGPATAGVSYVTRNWARDQHSFMVSDFKDAFKANWKQALVVSTITGLVPVIVYVCYRFYGQLAETNGMFFMIPQMLVIVIAVIWLLALEIIYTLMVTYDLSFGNLLRNAIVLAVGKLPLSLGIRLLTLALPLIGLALAWFIPSTGGYVMLVLVLYYLLFGFSLNRLIYASYANSVCEKYINPRIEGAQTNIGLRQTTEDDYEIDPTMPQPPTDEDEPKE